VFSAWFWLSDIIGVLTIKRSICFVFLARWFCFFGVDFCGFVFEPHKKAGAEGVKKKKMRIGKLPEH
jgi:hypothetical protein